MALLQKIIKKINKINIGLKKIGRPPQISPNNLQKERPFSKKINFYFSKYREFLPKARHRQALRETLRFLLLFS